jgi:hypothetical protein
MSTATTTTDATPRQTARAMLDQLRTTRQDAEAQARPLAQECAALKGRGAALVLDVKLGRAGAADERVDAAARLAAAEVQLEEQRQLVAEAQRREPAAIEALHAAALADLEAMRAELEAEERRLVAQIHTERERTPAEVCARAVIISRQLGGFEADLQEVMNAPRFVRRVGLRERLGPEVAARIPELAVRPADHKPPILRPWAPLLADLAETAT